MKSSITKRSAIETWYRSAVLAAVMVMLAECAGNLYRVSTNVKSFSHADRTTDDNSRSGFLPSIRVVEAAASEHSQSELTFEGFMPEIKGGVAWLNSTPLSTRSLRGRVVLINFWTYTCINSLRPLPYVKKWSAKYKDSGLVVIGVHTPEFSFEKQQPNVETAMREHDVTYPVVLDNNYQIWRAFTNDYWPAFYLIDQKGQMRPRELWPRMVACLQRAPGS